MKNKNYFNSNFIIRIKMKVYDLIEEAIDVRFMDVPNITSIILDYIETNIYHLDYLEVDNTLLDLDYDETRYILKACILASNEDEAYDLFMSHFNSLNGNYKLIDKHYFMGNLTMNEDKRYFTSPKVHYVFTEEKNYGVDRNFNDIVDIYNNYEYKHGKGGKTVNGRRYMY